MRLDRIQAAPLQSDPFDYMIVEQTIDPAELTELVRDFPEVPAGGSFDVATLDCGPAFRRLIDEMRTDKSCATCNQNVHRLFIRTF